MYKKLPPGFITRSFFILPGAAGLLLATRLYLNGDEPMHRKLIMPVAHRLFSGETAHRLAVALVKFKLTPPFGPIHQEYPQLQTTLFDKSFKNPIGLAAGFDKDAEAISGLENCGFGFIEVGTVTPLPQSGNPKPRVFRLIEDSAVINRYGFNSAGHGKVRTNLKSAFNPNSPVILGVNVGQNKVSTDPTLDYSVGVSLLGPYCQYLVINVSSPNTPGLRSLQRRKELEKLMTVVRDARNRIDSEKKPNILLKVAPDLTDDEKSDIAAVCMNKKYGIDGIIVTNTTVTRPEGLKSNFAAETGGLSGEPLRELSTETVRDFYRLTKGKLPIVGCGGISCGKDAYEKMRAGASLVQLYTGLVYQGFPIVGRVKRELVECLVNDGFENVAQAVGADHKK